MKTAQQKQIQTAHEMVEALRAELIAGLGGDTGAHYIAAAALIQAGLEIYFDTMPRDHAKMAAQHSVEDFAWHAGTLEAGDGA